MPDEYISREAAIEEIDKWLDAVGPALVGKGLSYYGELIGCIEDARTADVAEVVRCKDCKNLVNTTINANCFLICDISDMEIAPEDFCSHGERREE